MKSTALACALDVGSVMGFGDSIDMHGPHSPKSAEASNDVARAIFVMSVLSMPVVVKREENKGLLSD